MSLTDQEVLKLFEEEDERLEDVQQGSWKNDAKYQHRESIVRDTETGKLYAIYESRSGSYWQDYEYDDPTVCEVEAYTVMVTRYREVKQA